MKGTGLSSRARGMTLLEVMLALLLLLLLSAGVMGFFFQITARRDRLVRLATQQREVSLLFDRVESSLSASVAVSPEGSSGIRGDATSLSITTRGVVPAFDEEEGLADACTTTFAFDEGSSECVQTVTGTGGGGSSVSEPVLRFVERLRFRYTDGKQWSSTFDSIEASGLPVAVEVSVWFEPRVPRPKPDDSVSRGPMGGDGPDGLDAPLPGSESSSPGSLVFAQGQQEPDVPVWKPREPDHVRVISVPDAPDWQERSP